MFAVPGWSVSAENLITEKATSQRDSAQAGERGTEQTKQSRKRKRSLLEKAEVKAGDLERLWKAHFEGHEGAENKKKKKRKRNAERETNGYKLTCEMGADGDGRRPLGSENIMGLLKGSEEKTESTGIETKLLAATNGVLTRPPPYQASSLDPDRSQKIKQITDKRQTKQSPSASAPSNSSDSTSPSLAIPPRSPPPTNNLTPLQSRMRAKLLSARFRHLNETLYTSPSSSSLSLFTSDPSLFSEYHAGFSHQVQESWPLNPVETYVDAARRRAQVRSDSSKKGRSGSAGKGPVENAERVNEELRPLPRRRNGVCTIADLGCGDASLARALDPVSKRLGVRIHSYDLHASNEYVTTADISHLPLRDGQIDMTIFCLSLMGTNWIDFVEEAWRVLRGDGKGECWVAEVKSRFGRPKARTPTSRAIVGSKNAKSKKQNAKGKRGGGDVGQDDRDEPSHDQIFAEDSAPPQPGMDATDIAPFVSVFERRGFVLRPESVQRDNKMFIAMSFVKNGVPRGGKWQGMKWTGGKYEKVSIGDEEEEGEVEAEGKVLKPCVYKIR